MQILKKSCLLCFLMLLCSGLGYAQTSSGHQWKEMWYVGGHVGIHTLNDDDNYFGGVMGFYHTQLVHSHPNMFSDYISQYGIIGTGNYLREPDSDLVLTLQYSQGLVGGSDRTFTIGCRTVVVGVLWVGVLPRYSY